MQTLGEGLYSGGLLPQPFFHYSGGRGLQEGRGGEGIITAFYSFYFVVNKKSNDQEQKKKSRS